MTKVNAIEYLCNYVESKNIHVIKMQRFFYMALNKESLKEC